jgi:hypothetical protein
LWANIDGETGLVVEPRDSRALAEAIDKICSDPGLSERFAANGFERVTTVFAMDAMLDATIALYEEVLAHAGAVLPKRDVVDERIIREVRTGRTTYGDGMIDRVDQTEGWPELRRAPAPEDTDHDGIPDEWEKLHGLDPVNPADGNGDRDKDGYTNLEEYLNSLIVIA